MTEKNKGGQKAWATDEQKEWLTSKLSLYIASRSSLTPPADFWAGLFEDWFSRWPIGAADGNDTPLGVGLAEGNEAALGIAVEEQVRRRKAVSSFGCR